MSVSMNRLANTKNRFQTEAKRVLCLCSAGLLRSPTTANVLHAELGYNTRAAGVTEEYALVQVDPVLLEWADEVVCVESAVHDTLVRDWNDLLKHKRVITLNVPDQYEWNDPNLRMIISEQYAAAIRHN